MIELKEELKVPEFLSAEALSELTWKEQDFIILVHSKKYTRREIQRMLYLPSRS